MFHSGVLLLDFRNFRGASQKHLPNISPRSSTLRIEVLSRKPPAIVLQSLLATTHMRWLHHENTPKFGVTLITLNSEEIDVLEVLLFGNFGGFHFNRNMTVAQDSGSAASGDGHA